jgi:hypothetical protein
MEALGLWRKWIDAGGLRKATVIGLGLDFTDKAAG